MRKAVAQFFVQAKCVVCARRATVDFHWCRSCVKSLFHSRSEDSNAILDYGSACTSALLKELRGEHHLHALRFLGKVLAKREMPASFDFVVTAPQNREQTGLLSLASLLAKLLRAEFVPEYFSKVAGHRQHGKTAVDRMNAPFFIRTSRKQRLYQANVLLLDDVSTTGTTLQQCLAHLREIPVSQVECLVLASAKFKGEREETDEEG